MRSTHTTAYKEFLGRLVAAREKAGLTQAQVAAVLGIPQSRVSRMESGERRVDIIELVGFAKLYRKPLGWFVPAR
jgi:transcriptional regulator with XRE-family HTH domain